MWGRVGCAGVIDGYTRGCNGAAMGLQWGCNGDENEVDHGWIGCALAGLQRRWGEWFLKDWVMVKRRYV